MNVHAELPGFLLALQLSENTTLIGRNFIGVKSHQKLADRKQLEQELIILKKSSCIVLLILSLGFHLAIMKFSFSGFGNANLLGI